MFHSNHLLAVFYKEFQLLGAKFHSITESAYSDFHGASRNCERTQGHFDGFDRVGLLLHFRTCGQSFFCQQSVM
jgi:hypothetical protein